MISLIDKILEKTESRDLSVIYRLWRWDAHKRAFLVKTNSNTPRLHALTYDLGITRSKGDCDRFTRHDLANLGPHFPLLENIELAYQ